MKIQGIHHISTIVWHAQENVDFYAGVLGLKLIKRTLNFDDHNVYHLYYGNHNADLGTAITFFPWPNHYKEGMVGDGQVGVTSYMVPVGSLDFWKNRLTQFNVAFEAHERLGNKFLRFTDSHGIKSELIESSEGNQNLFEFNGVTKDVAIKGFYGALIYSSNYKGTVEHLTNDLGLTVVKEDNDYIRLDTGRILGRYVDVYKHKTGRSSMGAGSVHHIAFGVESSEIETWKTKLEAKGFTINGIKDRKFFKSLYYREPGGVIIELATLTPGFETDSEYKEAPDLYMPPHYMHLKDEVEAKLMPLFVKNIDSLYEYPYQNKDEYERWKAHQDLLNKINYYAKEAKVRTLTDKEIEERQELRHRYVKSIRGAIQNNLENIKIEDEDGDFQELKRKRGNVQ